MNSPAPCPLVSCLLAFVGEGCQQCCPIPCDRRLAARDVRQQRQPWARLHLQRAHVAFGRGERQGALKRCSCASSIRLPLADQGLEHQALDQVGVIPRCNCGEQLCQHSAGFAKELPAQSRGNSAPDAAAPASAAGHSSVRCRPQTRTPAPTGPLPSGRPAVPTTEPGGGQPGSGSAGCRNRCLRKPFLTATDALQCAIVIPLCLVYLRQHTISTHQQQALDRPAQQINALRRRVRRAREIVPFVPYLGALATWPMPAAGSR